MNDFKSDDEEPPRWFGLLLSAFIAVLSAAAFGTMVADIIRAAP